MAERRWTLHSLDLMKTILTAVLHRDQLEVKMIIQARGDDGLIRVIAVEGVRNTQPRVYFGGRQDLLTN